MRGYRHTQVGYATLAVLAAVLAIPLVLALTVPSGPGATGAAVVAVAVGVLLSACAVVFSTLTVEVADGRLTWSFGPGGWLRRSVPLDEVEEAAPDRAPLGGGLGIHLTSRGWLYNVSGRRVVRVRLREGRQVLLGTDEPEALARAIRAAVEAGTR